MELHRENFRLMMRFQRKLQRKLRVPVVEVLMARVGDFVANVPSMPVISVNIKYPLQFVVLIFIVVLPGSGININNACIVNEPKLMP